jgi:4-amino-4-deoxy-L-arabinose transferase-like glycosyltransferase
MTGRRLLWSAAVIVALAIIAVLWGMQLEANRRLREESAATRELVARLNTLEVENFRLSNIVVRARTPLAGAQLAELDQLRQEVQSLRRKTNDMRNMQVELRRVRAELLTARNSIASNAPPDVPAEDIYPRDSWQFAGYDTPEQALESATWAIGQGDEDTYMASLTPELRDEMQAELADGSFADAAPLEMSNTTGYRIVDREPLSDNEIIITVYMDGDGSEVPLTLVNTGDGWKVSGESGN